MNGREGDAKKMLFGEACMPHVSTACVINENNIKSELELKTKQ